jgi:hypothetical protein
MLKRERLCSLIAFFIVFIVKTVLLLQIIMCVKANIEIMKKNRIIRQATHADMAEIMMVMVSARQIMRSSGNLRQWDDSYPSEDIISSDMERCGGFVLEEDGRVVAYFAFLASPEPTYDKIYDGRWIDNEHSYHVIHRIASYPDVHHVFRDIMEYAFSKDRNIRIDTHRDNHIMQHNIEKHGFTYCGIIHLASGDERLAYQKYL